MEVAIVSSIFFFVVFATIEVGRVCMIRNLTQDAAYVAARQCMVDGATVQEAVGEAQRVLGLLGTKGASIKINQGQGLDENSPSIRVDVAVPLSQNSLVLSWIFAGRTIRASSELNTERYYGYYEAN